MSRQSDKDFEALEDQVDRLAAQGAGSAGGAGGAGGAGADAHHRFDPAHDEGDFESLISSALDELPQDVIEKLGNVPIIVSDGGAEEHAYGMYRGPSGRGSSALAGIFFGGGPGRSEILIFRDTLVRDYGRDPKLLRAKVTQTVRHEVGHYLGLDEAGVQRLGL